MSRAVLVLALVALSVGPGLAVDRNKFRTCEQTSFCRRHRHKAEPTVSLAPGSVSLQGNVLEAAVNPITGPPLKLSVTFLGSGTARFRVVEDTDMQPRWESPDTLVATATNVPAPDAAIRASSDAAVTTVLPNAPADATYVTYSSSAGTPHLFVLYNNPMGAELYVNGQKAIAVNEKSLFHFEHRQAHAGRHLLSESGEAVPDPNAGRKILDWGEDGKPIYEDGGDSVEADVSDPSSAGDVGTGRNLQAADDGAWVEKFHEHTDSKPNGPTSVGGDISFPGAYHVYGIPEHATSLSLKTTDGSPGGYSDPYRLYNLDVFEYELDNPMALYGSIPVMLSHGPTGTHGVFFNNPTEAFIDVERRSGNGMSTRWIFESGVVDLFLMPGATAKDVFFQYSQLTGGQALPPLFAIAYHQCRWNYKDEADVANVDAKFEEFNFPYDVLWLDIEHTDGKRYFTWDKHLFPNPAVMQDKLAARGRKMVTIVDPHIKRTGDYRVHNEATSNGYYIKNAKGSDFDGWCWPGSSSYLDFTSPKVRSWWADQFGLDKYVGATKNLYTWNDMNEPSVFNGPEVSMNKDAKSLEGVEHREWHNMYGFYQQWATGEGQSRRESEGNLRPFVLTRAFAAGSQRHGAMWTGDNTAEWGHLKIAPAMLMSSGVAGLTFAGADVGGFFKNPDVELMERWYQAGAFQPFFRQHAHIETKRREPWLFGEEVLYRIRQTVRDRYALLPYWYTLFHHASTEGVPVMRPLWVEYPGDSKTWAMDDQWLVGSDLLVKPVTDAGATSVDVYFPGDQPWVDVKSGAVVQAPGVQRIAAPIDKIPVFQRAGSIIPRKMRPRRCSALMAKDPYTLTIALDKAGKASGEVYLDDGMTFNYQRKDAFRLRSFTFEENKLSASMAAGSKAFAVANEVERLIIYGMGRKPNSVLASDSGGQNRPLDFTYDASTDAVTVRKPAVKVAYDWEITFA